MSCRSEIMSDRTLKPRIDLDLFRLAAFEGRLKDLKDMIVGQPKIAVKRAAMEKGSGLSALALASKEGHTRVVRFLVKECRADVNQYEYAVIDGRRMKGNPLWFTCLENQFPTAKALLKMGASPNPTGSRPLLVVATFASNNFDLVKLLVEYGTRINDPDEHGFTPLMAAVERKNMEIVEFLGENGADFYKIDEHGLTAFDRSVVGGSIPILRYLLSKITHELRLTQGIEELVEILKQHMDEHLPNRV